MDRLMKALKEIEELKIKQLSSLALDRVFDQPLESFDKNDHYELA